MKFSMINWGEDAAEQDSNLHNYFFRIPKFDEIVAGRIRYIVGRKGTGKTAIFEKLKSDYDNDPLKSVISLSFGDFPLNDLKSIKDRSAGDKYQYIPIWRFLILTEIAKEVVRDQRITNHEDLIQITNFLKENFPNDFSISDAVSYLRSNQSKLSITPKFFEIGSSSSDEKSFTGTIHYKKAADYLLNILSRVDNKVVYFVLFDGLDEGFKTSDKNLNLLLISLISAVEKLSSEFIFNQLSFYPILALRPDVLDSIGSNNLNKIDDYKINLNWNSRNLKSLISLRILASSNSIDIQKSKVNSEIIWQEVVNESTDKPKKTIWKYILDRTLLRPRDVIKFLKYCQQTDEPSQTGKLSIEEVQVAEVRYSDWFYREFKDEAYSILPREVWEDAMEVLSIIGKKVPYKNEILDELKKDRTIKKWCDSYSQEYDDILKLFFDYSVIGGMRNNNKAIFKYMEKSKWRPRSFTKCPVHLGLHKRLKLSKINFYLVSGLILDDKILGNFQNYFKITNSIFSVETEFHKNEKVFNAYVRFDIELVKEIDISSGFQINLSAVLLDFKKIEIGEISFSLKNGTRSYKRIIDVLSGEIEHAIIKLDGNIKLATSKKFLSEESPITTKKLRDKINQNAKYIKFKGVISS